MNLYTNHKQNHRHKNNNNNLKKPKGMSKGGQIRGFGVNIYILLYMK